MRSIAIPVADRQECAVALDVAFKLSRNLGADVVGYHMRPSKDMSTQDTRLSISAVWSEPWPLEDEKAADTAAESAHKLFAAMAEQNGFAVSKKHGKGLDLRALWREKLGTPDKLMPLIGPVNDLMVVSRPNKSGGRKAWLVLMSALLDSGIPVLVVPQKKAEVPCKHIAIAWNRGQQEAQAVHATLPLLLQAEQVTLLTVGKEPKHGPTAREMADYLKCHGINASEYRGSGEGGAGLVKAAQEAGADVLISGAYTKGRIRQMLFGGVTEHLIWNTNFPVILKHS
jgi:nucleotide-binding universal stress UspA family protein